MGLFSWFSGDENEDSSKTIIDYYPTLLRKSTIPCLICGQDIRIVHSLTQLKPKKEPEVKTIKIDDKEEPNGSKNDGSGGFQFGLVYGKKYVFEVEDFCENVEPQNENTIKWEFSYVDVNRVVVTGTFKKRGKKVKLKIDDLNMLGKTIIVSAFINAHLKSQEKEFWVHYRFRWFDREIFEKGLIMRKDKSSQIDQHATSLCGVAAMMYFYAKDYSGPFYNTFMEFFRTGEEKINQYKLYPNKSLYDMKPTQDNTNYPKSKSGSLMEQADWIVLAGIRSSGNNRFEGKNGEDWAAINWVGYMKKMAQQIYNIDEVIDRTFYIPLPLFRGKDFNNKVKESFKNIQFLFSMGYHVILMIDANMLDDITSIVGCVNQWHWISYLGELSIDEVNEQYSFKYYSWHKEHENHTFAASVVESNFYGYIAFLKK